MSIAASLFPYTTLFRSQRDPVLVFLCNVPFSQLEQLFFQKRLTLSLLIHAVLYKPYSRQVQLIVLGAPSLLVPRSRAQSSQPFCRRFHQLQLVLHRLLLVYVPLFQNEQLKFGLPSRQYVLCPSQTITFLMNSVWRLLFLVISS